MNYVHMKKRNINNDGTAIVNDLACKFSGPYENDLRTRVGPILK